MRDIVPIPLYHATFAQPPAELARGLHNVTPDELYRQLSWLREHFDVVTLDALLDDYAPGKAAVTFDDGYLCVFDEALAVLRELNVPATVFLNGFALAGRAFWRDKVRAVISAGQEAAFAAHALERAGLRLPPTAKGVYRGTKAPDGPSSRLVEQLVDDFLAQRGMDLAQPKPDTRDAGAQTAPPRPTRAANATDPGAVDSPGEGAQGARGQRSRDVETGRPPQRDPRGPKRTGRAAPDATASLTEAAPVAKDPSLRANGEAPVCLPGYCARAAELPDDPLVTYGNHSRSHYVLSTLGREEQREEIVGMQEELAGLGLRLSRVFSIPFGADADFNDQTVELLREAGLCAALSRNRLGGPTPVRLGGVAGAGEVVAVERFMAPPTLETFRQRIAEG